MKKLLKTQDILLLGLSGALDLFEELRDPFGVAAKSYKSMYGWVPERYKKHNFNHLVWRNIKTGYIEKIEREGEIYIRLTSQGTKRITRDFPLLSLQKIKWDKKWRVVIFDIAEVNRNARDSLRKKLKELGFGMIQKSVFISPHDVIKDFAEFIKNYGLDEAVYTFEASSLATGDVKELTNKVWNLDSLNKKYREIIEKIEDSHLIEIHDRVSSLNASGKSLSTILTSGSILERELKEQYLQVTLQDPFLPKELLPIDWKGDRARVLIRRLH